MRRRIIWILAGAVLLLLLVALLWWWFLRNPVETPAPSGGLGTGDDRSGQTTQGGSGANIGAPLQPGQTIIGGTTDIGGGGMGGTGGGGGGTGGGGTGGGGTGGGEGGGPETPFTPGVIIPPGEPFGPTTTTPGVSWLGGNNIFTPTPINPIGSGTTGSVPTFGTVNVQTGGGGGGDTGINSLLPGLGVGAALCAAQPLVSSALGAFASLVTSVVAVPVTAPIQNLKDSDSIQERFLACVARHLIRVALDQMTASIVNWINSGFEGKPSFVTNYNQFFTNVADQAAGEFIRGSALSFLCSPFQPQVRIAIAQSYARRNNAPSCSLSQVTRNMQGFMNRFDQGGWPAFISFTTTPTNNPYGAYMYGERVLNENIQYRVAQNQLDITLGRGFMSRRVCTQGPIINDGSQRRMPDECKIETPGTTIESTLASTLGIPQNYLTQAGISGNFDAIISALIQQLVSRTLQGGLANLSGTSGYQTTITTTENIEAQQAAQALLTELQGAVSTAQQYGYAKQGSISDIQNAQRQLQDLASCRTAQNDTAGQQAAETQIATLETRVAVLNNDITRANAAIAALQALQTRVFSASKPADVTAARADFTAAQASGSLIASAAVVQAQQDRTALQAEMAALNQQTAAQLNQCSGGF